MPYVPGGTSQGNSGSPEVLDVYHSPTVFANNVGVALWQTPGESAGFAGLSLSPSVQISQPRQEAIDADTLSAMALCIFAIFECLSI